MTTTSLIDEKRNAFMKENRFFEDHSHYFVLREPSMLMEVGGNYEVAAWNKTHVVIQKCAMSGDLGLQIKRFNESKDKYTWGMAENPWAGVYLTKEEWKIIFDRMNGL